MIEYEQIPLKDLEIDCWYIGRGRGGDIGRWDGSVFTTICFYEKSWAEIQVLRGGKTPDRRDTEGREIIKYESYFYKNEASMPKYLLKEQKDIGRIELGSFQPFIKVDFGEIVGEKYDGKYSRYGEKLRINQTTTS